MFKLSALSVLCGDLLNGSGISGVTGLSTSEGKSSMLGDRISGVPNRGEPENPPPNPGLLANPAPNGLILKFFRLFLLSYSLEADFSFLGPVLMGGIGLRAGSGLVEAAACLAVSESPGKKLELRYGSLEFGKKCFVGGTFEGTVTLSLVRVTQRCFRLRRRRGGERVVLVVLAAVEIKQSNKLQLVAGDWWRLEYLYQPKEFVKQVSIQAIDLKGPLKMKAYSGHVS
nr:hypothetical protein Iba_chr04aCG5550 [Ipomoea batatas]